MIEDYGSNGDNSRLDGGETDADRRVAERFRVAYYATGAYRSAIAHPFHVSVYESWRGDPTVVVGFQTEEEARAFAASRPETLIDLVRRDHGVIAARRTIQHLVNTEFDIPFVPRDDFPQTDD